MGMQGALEEKIIDPDGIERPKTTSFILSVEIDGLTIVSEANCRDNWRKKASRVKKQRDKAKLSCGIAYFRKYQKKWDFTGFRLIVNLVRKYSGRGKPFDGDNLQASLKAVRDGVADFIGMDDGSEKIVWTYEQKQGNSQSVEVSIWKE